MDWQAYKRICDAPNVFSRWMLEQTLELAEPPEAEVLRRALTGRTVPKPADHSGDAATDMFELELGDETRRRILEAVSRAVNSGVTSTGTRRRGLGGFLAAWAEYADARLAGSVMPDDVP